MSSLALDQIIFKATRQGVERWVVEEQVHGGFRVGQLKQPFGSTVIKSLSPPFYATQEAAVHMCRVIT